MAAVEIEIGGHRDRPACSAVHARAGLDDLAGDLVADDARELDLPPPGLGVLDGQARAAGDDARHRLARARRPGRAAATRSNGRFGPFSTIAFMASPPRLNFATRSRRSEPTLMEGAGGGRIVYSRARAGPAGGASGGTARRRVMADQDNKSRRAQPAASADGDDPLHRPAGDGARPSPTPSTTSISTASRCGSNSASPGSTT